MYFRKIKIFCPAILLFLLFRPEMIFSLSIQQDTLHLAADQKVRVDSIAISGNDITEEFIILRELTFSSGDIIGAKEIDFNRERIFSLGLFNQVKLIPVREDYKTTMYINVKETWYIYPIPFIFTQSSLFHKATYGISLVVNNFRGRNETLYAIFGVGYDPFFTLRYVNPALIYDEGIGIAVSSSYMNSYNKNREAEILYGKQFRIKSFRNTLSLFKRLNQFNTVSLSAGVNYIENPVNGIGGMSAGEGRIDRVLVLSAGYEYDSRDLKQFPSEGLYTGIAYSHKGFGINNTNYDIFYIDFREYRKVITPLTARWRIAYRHTFGRQVPFYDYSFLGYEDYVRGHRDDYREGHNSILTSVELSYPIISEWNVSLKLPLLPQSLTSARIAVHINLFADAGSAYTNNQSLSFRDFYSGYGAGINILFLPFNSVRFEYAFNEKGKGEFLIGTGFAF